MSVGNETGNRRTPSRMLSMAALANAVLWALSIIALIFVIQRCSSAKGFFVILAVGLATALTLIAAVRKQG